MKKILVVSLVILLFAPASLLAMSGAERDSVTPNITVTGNGEVMALPDRAVIRLGVLAQAKQAAEAQQQANQTIRQALAKFRQLNIPDEKISTVGLTLMPVFSRQDPKKLEEPFEPVIVAYQARNTVQVVSDDVTAVGGIVDAGIAAGANQLEGISFEVKDDLKHRQQALRIAVAEARKKADAVAAEMGLSIVGVIEVSEGGAQVFRPAMQVARSFAADLATPVQPGQLKIEASVTVSFRIAEQAVTKTGG